MTRACPSANLRASSLAAHLLIERDRGQFVPSRRRRMMANVRAERLLKIPAEPSPKLRIPYAAAQTRVVSLAGIRLGSSKSARAFKGIICDWMSKTYLKSDHFDGGGSIVRHDIAEFTSRFNGQYATWFSEITFPALALSPSPRR
jgi:hypothetical protein